MFQPWITDLWGRPENALAGSRFETTPPSLEDVSGVGAAMVKHRGPVSAHACVGS